MNAAFDDWRREFPIYQQQPNLCYFDYAATTFLPRQVLARWMTYHERIGVAAFRGQSTLNVLAMDAYLEAKQCLLAFLGADETYDLAFSKNATESLNLIAHGMARNVEAGDLILVSGYEHHSNLLPWKRLAQQRDAILATIPLLPDGNLDYSVLDRLTNQHVKIVSVPLIANVNGHRLDYPKIHRFASTEAAKLVLDITQAVAHEPIDCTRYDADAYCCSAHKMYGPKQIGALVYKRTLQEMDPLLLGGGMVWNIFGEQITCADGAQKFEAGTYDIGAMSAWAEACRFIEQIGFNTIQNYDVAIYQAIVESLRSQSEIALVPSGGSHARSILAFTHAAQHSHDLLPILDASDIVIRVGHLCSQGTMAGLGLTSVNRISWGIGTNQASIERLGDAIARLS